MDIDNATAPYD